MKIHFIIVLVFVFISGLNAQNNKIDSLLALTKDCTNDKRIEIYLQLAKISDDSSAYNDVIYYSKKAGVLSRETADIEKTILADYYTGIGYNFTNQYDSAMIYYQSVMDNLSIVNDSAKMPVVLRSIGILYHEQGNLSLAKTKYEESIAIAKRINDTRSIFSGIKSLGLYYSDIGAYESAVKEYLLALGIVQEKNIPGAQSNILISLGNIYGKMENYNKALEYQKAACKLLNTHRDMQAMASALNNIGIIYKLTGEYDSAFHYYNRSLEIKLKFGQKHMIVSSLLNIGLLLSGQGKQDEAIRYFDEGLHMADSNMLLQSKVDLLEAKALALIDKGQYDPAYRYLLEGLDIAREKGYREKTRDFYEALAGFYTKTGDDGEANKYLKLYIAYNDSILNESSQEAIIEMQTRFETEKVEKENELLNKNAEIQTLKLRKQQTQFWLLGAGICFIILLGILAFVSYRLRQRNKHALLEKKNAETEKRMLRSQMNPHFIFNAMSSIQGYIAGNDNYNAMMYLSNFAELTRGILENSRHEMIPLDEEIKTLKLYIELEHLRLKNKFDFSINLDTELDPETIFIPPMMIQPFVENAIKHAFKNKDGDGMLTIDLKKEKDLIICSVSDNGAGRDMTKKNKPEGHRSLGMKVTQERLEMIKKEKKVNCYYIIHDLKDDNGKASGTSVDISLPFEEE